jgi:hypothetical protein
MTDAKMSITTMKMKNIALVFLVLLGGCVVYGTAPSGTQSIGCTSDNDCGPGRGCRALVSSGGSQRACFPGGPKQCTTSADCSQGLTCQQMARYNYSASDAPNILVWNACLPPAPPQKRAWHNAY